MSKTDMHRPYYAYDRNNYKEYHNHNDGECTLVDFSTFVKSGPKIMENKCGYALKSSFLSEHHICGCKLCRNSVERKQNNRKERYNKKYRQEIYS